MLFWMLLLVLGPYAQPEAFELIAVFPSSSKPQARLAPVAQYVDTQYGHPCPSAMKILRYSGTIYCRSKQDTLGILKPCVWL
jgi:hypothetical protein